MAYFEPAVLFGVAALFSGIGTLLNGLAAIIGAFRSTLSHPN